MFLKQRSDDIVVIFFTRETVDRVDYKVLDSAPVLLSVQDQPLKLRAGRSLCRFAFLDEYPIDAETVPVTVFFTLRLLGGEA